MKHKNSHVTYVYLLRDVKSGCIFSLAHDSTPADYSDEETELLGAATIDWGEEAND